MAISITESVQKMMGFEPLKKVDPNTQEPFYTEVFTSPSSALAQAAIPAVLVAIYKKTRTVDGAFELLSITNSANYLRVLFGENTPRAIQAVASYSKTSAYEAGKAMQQVAGTALQVVQSKITHPAPEAVSSFLSGERSDILSYLPASVQMGRMLDDPTLDDSTNKMEGPVSGLMHTIENIFAGTK